MYVRIRNFGSSKDSNRKKSIVHYQQIINVHKQIIWCRESSTTYMDTQVPWVGFGRRFTKYSTVPKPRYEYFLQTTVSYVYCRYLLLVNPTVHSCLESVFNHVGTVAATAAAEAGKKKGEKEEKVDLLFDAVFSVGNPNKRISPSSPSPSYNISSSSSSSSSFVCTFVCPLLSFAKQWFFFFAANNNRDSLTLHF